MSNLQIFGPSASISCTFFNRRIDNFINQMMKFIVCLKCQEYIGIEVLFHTLGGSLSYSRSVEKKCPLSDLIRGSGEIQWLSFHSLN